MRKSTVKRTTAETSIQLELCLDGRGNYEIATGIGFFDHMLELFTRHGRFDLKVHCEGDLQVDGHHSVEDIGIALGQAFQEALGDKKGICRYGDILLPMDEALLLCAADFSGRPSLHFSVDIPAYQIGAFDTELTEEFLTAFVRTAGLTLHAKLLAGTNSHHIVEALFKALGRVLGQAVSVDPKCPNQIPSTKGIL